MLIVIIDLVPATIDLIFASVILALVRADLMLASISLILSSIGLKLGQVLGGLMNATFGNAVELIVSTLLDKPKLLSLIT